ncbi:hypothetical protein DV737_g4284, partial [Chaetothyriales sp. CBS 132003]
MASADNTHVPISAIKASFLHTQTRLLCAPLHLSPAYRSWLRRSDTNHGLSDKQLANLQKRVNDKISQHSKAVFSSQSISHVAEQIETLYWNQQDVQLTDEQVVEELPDALGDVLLRDHSHAEAVAETEAARRYAQLRGRLGALAKKRGEALQRLQRYQRLQGLLRAYQEPKRRIQPNLVTAKGEMRRELERTRVLLARVDARALPVARDRHGGEARRFDQKLEQVMELG